MPIRLARMNKKSTPVGFYSPRLHRLVFGAALVGNCWLCSMSVVAGSAAVDVDYSALNDSNFSRTEQGHEETIHLLGLGVMGAADLSKQQLKVALKFKQLYYDTNQALDASYVLGDANWRGQIGNKILLDAAIKRDAYAVDPLEYKGKDIVGKNEFIARAGYGTREKLSLWVGGTEINQTHSATEREILDFDQQEVFAEFIAQKGASFQHQLRASNGERRYKTGVSSAGDFIDFDYRQYSYDLKLIKNTDNQFSLGIARFDREGEINSDTGVLWHAQWLWQLTAKVSLQLGYEVNEPAAGEEIEFPTELNDTSVALRWQVSPRWRVESHFAYSEQQYISQITQAERDEKWQRWRPLVLVYSGVKNFSVRLEAELYDRQSTLAFRDYEGEKINLMLSLHF